MNDYNSIVRYEYPYCSSLSRSPLHEIAIQRPQSALNFLHHEQMHEIHKLRIQNEHEINAIRIQEKANINNALLSSQTQLGVAFITNRYANERNCIVLNKNKVRDGIADGFFGSSYPYEVEGNFAIHIY